MGSGRAPCCDKSKVKKGPWSPDEDLTLITFVHHHGHPNWRSLPKQAGLSRCGKSCRLRWINYLRPDLKRGNFTKEEEDTIIKLHQSLGNKWSKIASHLPGRTDNEVKNVWNTHLKKRLMVMIKKDQEDANFNHTYVAKQFSSTSSPSPSSSSAGLPFMSRPHDEGTPSGNDEPKEASISSVSSHASNIYSGPNRVVDDQVMIEIPLEPEINLWDMLDNLESNHEPQTLEFEVANSRDSNFDEYDKEIDECRKWLRYLENELGLEATS